MNRKYLFMGVISLISKVAAIAIIVGGFYIISDVLLSGRLTARQDIFVLTHQLFILFMVAMVSALGCVSVALILDYLIDHSEKHDRAIFLLEQLVRLADKNRG